MLAQIPELFWLAARLQVRGAPADDDADRADAGRNHAAVRQDPDADRDIDVLFDHVNDVVSQHQPQGNLRVGLEEFNSKRQQMDVAEAPWRSHRQLSFGASILARHLPFGLVYLLDDALAGLDVGPSRIGQSQTPRSALEQLGIQA